MPYEHHVLNYTCMHSELGHPPVDIPHVEGTARWIKNRHLWDIFSHDPRAAQQFVRVLQLSIMQEALAKASACDDLQLADTLARGLREAYQDQGDAAPKTVADLDARAGLADPGAKQRTPEEIAQGINPPPTTGVARDYMMQRLGAVAGIADLAAAMPLPPALIESLQRESDRLATLLVAFERAEQAESDVIAAK